jgi:Spy/CpxP family protein refolding chaperone
MNHLSAVIESNSTGAAQRHIATQHLLAFTTACSQCTSVLDNLPSLRDVAFDRLSGFLRGHVSVWNPDIIFLNTASVPGGPRSRSLTDALIEAMTSGAKTLTPDIQALYYHHDSTEAQHQVPEKDFITIKSIFGQVLARFPGAYHGALALAWDSPEPSSAQGRNAARHQVIGRHHQSALKHDIEFQLIEQRLNNEEKIRLVQVLSHQPTGGLFKISLRVPGERTAPLLSLFVVSQDQNAAAPRSTSGPCYLLMAAGGIERYESFSELNSELARRLSGASGQEPLLKSLYLSDLARLPENHVVGNDDLDYEPCTEPMLYCHVRGLRNKQARDFDFLVQQARANSDSYPFLEKVSEVQVCAHVDEVMGHHFKSLSVRAQDLAQPRWLKYADAADREHYAKLDRQYSERKQAVDALMDGLESLEVFARNEIDRYVRKHLGYSVDVQQVMISLSDGFDIQSGAFLIKNRKSLIEFAMLGLPTVSGDGEVILPAVHANPAFTFGFVKTMLDELDVQRRYRQQLRARLTHERTLRALTHRRDAALALSTLAALLQGHLADERSLDLIHGVRADIVQDGVATTLGSLKLAVNGVRFKDLLVFRNRDAAGDDHYALYAPGAPGGQDMFGFTSWRHLSIEVGRWLGTDAGASYVLDQTATATTPEPHHSDFLEKVRRKGSLWSKSSVDFQELDGDNFEERLSDAIRHKIERALTRDETALAGFTMETAYANRGALALLEHRINELNKAFVHTTQAMVSFEQFARREGSKLLNDYISSQGVGERVDTDTIFVDLDNASYVATPDFTEYSRLRSLTSLFMEGFSDQYAYTSKAPMYSSVGQDLRALPLYFVQRVDKALREAALGERYIQWIQQEFLDASHERYGYRRALFGRRLQFDMRLAAMREFLNGDLSTAQYQWLVQLIVSLDKQVLEQNKGLQHLIKRSSAAMFRFAGYIVQGVYMLRDFSSPDGDFNLLYTPDAPDGISFRKLTDYGDLMGSPDMRRYYYLRVPYKGQPSVGSRFDDMDRNLPVRLKIDNAEHQNSDRITDIHDLYDEQISRIVADVDAQTKSTTERWAEKIYSVVRLLGSALLMPFPGAALAWTGLHLAIDIQRGLLAYQDGDRATASWFFGAAVYGTLLGGAGVKTVVTHDKALIVKVGQWAVKKLAAQTG